MNEIDKYFDKPAFAGFALLLPSTFIMISLLLRAVDSDILFRTILEIKRSVNPFTFVYFASLLSVTVCFADIIKINSRQTDRSTEREFVYRKSFVNISIISVNAIYVFIIFIYREFEKLGNIPVGRD